jgi:predicted oxidoreductase
MSANQTLPVPATMRRLGNSELEVSGIAWGMWRLAENGRSCCRSCASWSMPRSMRGLISLILQISMAFNGTWAAFGDAEALLGEVLAAEPALRDSHGAGEQRRDHAAFTLRPERQNI